jgi:serine/threonine-protein kinase
MQGGCLMNGKIVNGYRIFDFVGKGQFGTVYKCEKEGNIYAIKIFNLDYVYNEFKTHGEDNRVTREIQALKIVEHENVIKMIDEGIFEDNSQSYVYVVMEYLDGVDLKEYLYSNELKLEDIDGLFRQIIEGLDAVHKRNIVHRDLKPQNIFIANDGKIKLLDFGLSKLIDFTSITSTGDTIGSPVYMSPEQVMDSKNVDYRSDYYALGVILFELIAKEFPYGEVISREHLYYKIIHEPPLSILQFEPLTPNCIDNLIVNLLSKKNYQRPNNKEEILYYLNQINMAEACKTMKQFEPNFFLRVWNEKGVLEGYYNDGFQVENIVFPINHQSGQKGLLNHIKKNNINFIMDPSTMRLAYDTFADVKGLAALPYAPQDFTRLELDNFIGLGQKKEYIRLVIQEQLKHNPGCIVSPFHVSNNSNFVTIKNANAETWFSLDVKLLKETKDYLIENNIDKKIVAGFCIKADILTSQTEKEYFLNVLSGLPCDIYWIYVDCIDYNTGAAQLYHYISMLLELQNATNKPVIAGRVGSIGLLLLAFGIYGFESGAARFESFYEDLYKEVTDSYNMYVMYYMPELLRNIPVERKNPSKIIGILKTKTGIDLNCDCPYCSGKKPEELIQVEADTKRHFLYRRQQEIEVLRSLNISERLDYMEERIEKAIIYYRDLTPIFKETDYGFLRTWQRIIPELRKHYGL